ncbi:MAG: hypothetical protein MJK04_31095, partial [Psychrosphaera sp.]|nr:hypothetical protein [Psychrosphaera sp.]
RIEASITDSLDYFSENFGPYQHKQARVIEVASNHTFGQDFPNTIAYSERAGFIHDQSDPNDNDQVYLIIAHEMAHQWWGAQIDPANVQGGTFIIETLAQYSAYMLVRNKYGKERVSAMLKYELDRYLSRRSRETNQELPLIKVEDQAYIHYNKGAIAMMALADRLGEERLNLALKRFLQRYKFSQGEYPTSLDLMAFIKDGASEQELAFITRSFFEINIYDLRLISAKTEALASGQYKITLSIEAKRLLVDQELGEQPAVLNEMVDIGLWQSGGAKHMHGKGHSVDDSAFYLQQHSIKNGQNIVEIIVDKTPTLAVLDPHIQFIDRELADNRVTF